MSKLIVFEGVDGSGKSTQAKLLFNHLTESGIPAILTREPGGSPFGEKIRELLLSEKNLTDKERAYLFFAIRSKHIRDTVLPALETGKHVICDRFYFSTFVYQYKFLEEIDDDNMINFLLTDPCNDVFPDVVIWTDVDASVAVERLNLRNEFNVLDSVDKNDIKAKADRFYLGLRKYNYSRNIIKIDGNQSEDEVFRNIIHNLQIRKII